MAQRRSAVGGTWRSVRRPWAAATLFVACAAGWAGLARADEPPSEPFPEYDSLRGHVEFWIRVFSEWDLGQVAVHDVEHPSVVYEIAQLPGPPRIPYSDAQREFVDDLRERWEDTLQRLERKVDSGEALDDGEKALALQITTGAGTDAIRGAHERLRTQRGLLTQFRRGLEISGRYLERFRQVFREQGLPEDLAYLPHVESSFQGSARSSAGAVGLWQFTRGTGRHYLVIHSALDERLDPVAAAYGAARYLKEAHDKLGSWPLALTAYNHGIQGMVKAEEEFGIDFERIGREYRSRSFGFASRNFYAEFLAAREIAREPERFFPDGIDFEPPLASGEIVLEHRATPAQIARAHGVPLDRMVALNPGWTSRAIRGGHALPAGTRVWLPFDAPAVAETYGGSTHVVRSGDTLSTIAQRYGLTIAELRNLNGIPAKQSLIRVGQALRVARDGDARDSKVHVVRRGETLLRIASAYGVKLADLLLANGLSVKSIIHPGQQIHIPLP